MKYSNIQEKRKKHGVSKPPRMHGKRDEKQVCDVLRQSVCEVDIYVGVRSKVVFLINIITMTWESRVGTTTKLQCSASEMNNTSTYFFS
jgi:hypothetical protein